MTFPSPEDVALAQLASPVPAIRKLGAQALCTIRPRGEVRTIEEAFRLEPKPGVAKWLALALGKLGSPSSKEPLTARLKALADCDLRDWIQVALNMIRRFEPNKGILLRIHSQDPAANKEGLVLSWSKPALSTKIVQQERKLLESDDPAVRRWASLALGSQKDFAVDEPVLEHLNDPDELVLEWTEHVITGRVPEAALPILQSKLESPSPRVREWAIKALASRPDAGVYSLLLKRYDNEPDELCREAIIRALKPLTSALETQEFLIRVAKTEKRQVILSALIDLAAHSPALRKNQAFISELVEKANRATSPALRVSISGAFSSSLRLEDRRLLEAIQESEDASEALRFFTNVPWDDTQLPTPQRTRNTCIMITKPPEPIVAVLIAKKDEFRAFVEVMGSYEPSEEPGTGKTIYSFKLTDGAGAPVNVVAVLVGGMGNTKSSFWAQQLQAKFTPVILVNMGIAGGIHEDVRLADVVVATQIEDYIADAKAIPSQATPSFTLALAGDTYKPDKYLVNIAQNIEFAHKAAFSCWESVASKSISAMPEKQRNDLLAKGLIRPKPVIEEGHIASGPIVGASQSFIAWLKTQADRSFLALEMESAGGALALYEGASTARHLVIRGISDYGDERKKDLDAIGNGGIRTLAMENATRLLLELIGIVSIDDLRSKGGIAP